MFDSENLKQNCIIYICPPFSLTNLFKTHNETSVF